MKIIKPNVELIKADNPMKIVELAGRTCYKSEESITENSYQTFVQKMIKSKHHAMLEHANYTFIDNGDRDYLLSRESYIREWLINEFKNDRYIKTTQHMFTVNLRTMVENNVDVNWFLERDFIQPNWDEWNMDEYKLKHKHITLKFICDRGVSHEIVRHRTASFAQESTRYCNYSKDKFGNELTFIQPCFTELNSPQYLLWESSCRLIEINYFTLLQEGWTPQEARSILPNSLKTEIVMTTNLEGWKHFLDLRYKGITGKPHPQIHEVACMARDILLTEEPEIFAEYK